MDGRTDRRMKQGFSSLSTVFHSYRENQKATGLLVRYSVAGGIRSGIHWIRLALVGYIKIVYNMYIFYHS